MSRPRASSIESPRLYLAAATEALIRADLEGPAALAAGLGVAPPEDWPPALHSRPVLEAVALQLRDRAEMGWHVWYLVGREAHEGLVGVAGFEGRPDADGSVELAYSVLPAFQNRGYASEAVARLVQWAFSHQQVNRVTAETLPHLANSIRVLQRNGFRAAGRGSEYGVVRYALERSRLS
ncbi:MAG: GNAT family N-acetyltransferase [Xanthomonadales bacterium]|nr:GNAT family N-acetyltransferase [Xanthomonadales bacterium]